jgi:hypothetical protein
VVLSLRSKPVVFYHDNGSTIFEVFAFTDEGWVIDLTDLGTKPETFDDDFPDAIGLAGDFDFIPVS